MSRRDYWVGLAKDWGIALVIVAVIMVGWGLFFAPSPTSSGPAPPFEASTTQGQTVQIPADSGHVAVLNFWFTTCGPCRHEIPELSAFHDAHPEIPMYGISVDRMPADRLEKISRKLGITYDVLMDPNSEIAHKYGVDLFPTTFILHDGEVAFVKMGEMDKAALETAVAAFQH